MVDIQEAGLDAVFHALGDVTRRRMLGHLAQGERTVGQLAEPFQMSLAAASKHVKALEGAGLIRREVRGRVHICRLAAEPLSAASDWLRCYEQFWQLRLDRLEGLLRQDAAQAAVTPNATPQNTPDAPPAATPAAPPPSTPSTAHGGTATPPRAKATRSPR